MAKRRDQGEGSVYQRERDGKWVASLDLGWVNGKRKRVERTAATKRDALMLLADLKKNATEGITPEAARKTMGGFLNDWLEGTVKETLRPRSYERYRDVIRLHIDPALGKEPLAKLTPARIERFLKEKKDGGLAPRSVQFIHAVLRRSLNQALRWGMISRNPAALVSSPRAEVYNAKPLTPDEAKVFLEAAKGDRAEALYSVALALGLRQGEALGLRWADVDFDKSALHVNRNLQRIGSKLQLVEPKTAQSRRTLPLPANLAKALRRHRARQLEDKLLAGDKWQENDLIFPTRYGTPQRAANCLKAFKRLLVRAGLPERRYHDLRHSTATLLLVQGIPMRVVMELLGHTKMATTADLYTHVLPALEAEAVAQLDRLLG